MDKKKGILNIGASISSRVILLVMALFVRRLLIVCIGNDVNGLNSLYTSIIGLLSVAELGVGSAIVFSMYKPVTEGDERKVAALYCLYRRLYRLIGAAIFFAGLAVMPFLSHLISDYEAVEVNVYEAFLITLVSVVLSYIYSAKFSLLDAHKNNYITTAIVSISGIIRYILQIAALLLTGSYIIYLMCQIVETAVVWIITESVVRRLYPDTLRMNEKLDKESTEEVTRNVKAMFMHKVGSILVGSVDSMVISAFIGVTILGKYGNYTVLAGAMTGTIALFFTPLTSVIGHLCATGRTEEIKKQFEHLYCLNYLLGIIFFLGYYAVADDLVALVFGEGQELPEAIPFIITANSFVLYMRYAQLLFRDASGTFYYDRWKPLAEGCVNLSLSVLLVKALPSEYGVVGVILATIVTTLFICDIIEPYVIFRFVFKEPVKKFYIRNYTYILIFLAWLPIMNTIRVQTDNNLMGLLVNGAVSLCLSGLLLLILSTADRKFRKELFTIATQLDQWIKRTLKRRKCV